jgi:hypothetical protein
MKTVSDLKKTLFGRVKIKNYQAKQKDNILSTVTIVCLEQYGTKVVSWLSSDFFDSFQFFVFIEVESMNSRILVFEVINGSADVNSRSRTCRLKYKNYHFLNKFSNLQKFADSAPLIVFEFPNSSLGSSSTSVISSAEEQHRSIVQADKAVLRNSPENVKIFKNN